MRRAKTAAKAAKFARQRKPASAAAKAERAVEAALAALAHEVRTPLTGILALGELLAASDLPEREREWALAIKSAAEHLAQLTTVVVDGVKAGARGLVLRDEPFRPRRVIEAVAATLTARARTKNLSTELTIAEDLPGMVVGDPVRLRAALENLIDNAVKFTERGTVALRATAKPVRRGVRLDFEVTDSGIGLTGAEIKRLGRPFSQAGAGVARRFGGAGLGLSLVKRMAEAMGGNLTIKSVPRRGSTFHFHVVVQTAPGGSADAERAAPTQAARPLRVLCAEDNPYGRVILNTILAELGHRADFVGSGEAAIEAVERGYDLVLMDVTLSGLDGIAATRRIRALGDDAARVPIVGLSGRSRPGEEAAARAAGMDDYLVKPVSPSALARVLALRGA
jgi:CheY-like chemotaxis protein/nitrogen-specific signal transduction histidine kinase